MENRNALKRPKKNTTRTRAPIEETAQLVRSMSDRGLKNKDIAEQLGVSERHVYNIKSKHGLLNRGQPISRDDLDAELRSMVEFRTDAFEAFFNAYSGVTLQPLHKEWVEQAINSNRVLINCPPRHAKSEIFSVWFPIWLVCANKNEQILIVSQTDKLAKKFTNKIAYHLAYNQKLIRDYGPFMSSSADWPWRPNSGELMVQGRNRETESGDLTIQVRGSGQQILGMEATWIIIDDPVSRKVANSDSEREKLSEWFHGDVMSRLERSGRAICIGQRLHLRDLYGELANEKDPTGRFAWSHINYPAILDWNKKTTLWPELLRTVEGKPSEPKWDFEAMMQVYRDVGEDIFTTMYQQEPLAVSKRLARTEWLYGSDEHLGCTDGQRAAGQGLREGSPLNYVRVASLDPSPTRYAGFIIADVQRGKFDDPFECNIIEITREKMDVREMVHQLDRVIATYRPDYFIFEQAAAQRWFLQDPAMDRIKQQLTVLPHNTGNNKGDPLLGVESLAMDFEFGRIRVPYGDAEGRAMSEQLFDEARQYPQGQTDDLLMALWFIKFNNMRLHPRARAIGQKKDPRAFKIPPRLAAGFGRR